MNILQHYQNAETKFGEQFHSITLKHNESISWPHGYGVYVIWKKDKNSIENLIYVGLTGRFKRNSNNEIVINSGSFSKRKERWTPYRFCEHDNDEELKFSFRFNPRESKTSLQQQIKFEKNAYSETIFYKEGIIMDFFIFNKELNANHGYTPALLEAELLSKYLIETSKLPPANNSL
jgi:hypothetical protein